MDETSHCVMQFTLQAEGAAARLRASGYLSVAGALHVVRCCRRLPPEVATLHADLTELRADDARSMGAFVALLGQWRRGGRVTVRGPGSRYALPAAPPAPPSDGGITGETARGVASRQRRSGSDHGRSSQLGG